MLGESLGLILRPMPRITVGGFLVAAAITVFTPAAGAAEYVLPRADAPIFTIAGGGTAGPKVGRAATDVELHPREALYLPDGRAAVLDARVPGDGRLVIIGSDGRISAINPFPP